MAEHDEPEESEMYVRLMAAIDDNYIPAATVQEADLYLDTKQILDNLAPMEPKIDRGKLGEFLLANGFIFENIGDMQFAWLLKNR
jgi:hypothetical protein